MRKNKGFSLLELLFALSLMVIIFMIIVPSQNIFLTKSKTDVLSSQLMHAIALTRSESIARGEKVTLCGSRDQITCTYFNNMGYLIFSAEKMLYTLQNTTNDGVMHWQAFPNGRTDLQYLSSGLTNSENGTFWYCEKNASTPSFAVTVSQSGRPRVMSTAEIACGDYSCY